MCFCSARVQLVRRIVVLSVGAWKDDQRVMLHVESLWDM
jgi:hypothetical protein